MVPASTTEECIANFGRWAATRGLARNLRMYGMTPSEAIDEALVQVSVGTMPMWSEEVDQMAFMSKHPFRPIDE